MHARVRPLLFTAAIAGAVAVTASPAQSDHLHSGFCTGATASDRSSLLFNHFHAANDDASAARALICPFFHDVDSTWGDLPGQYHINYFDRNIDQPLSCRMEFTDMNWALVVTPERYSCSTTGGCASPAQFADSQNRGLSLVPNVSGIPRFFKYTFRCSIPAKTAVGVSGISDYGGSNN